MEAGSISRCTGPRGGTQPPRGAPRWGEDLIKGLLMLAALISVLTTTGIVLSLLQETIKFFGEVGVATSCSAPTGRRSSSRPASACCRWCWARCVIRAIAMLVAIPLGPGSGDLPAEYARPGVRKTIKPILELLAGVPTIVFGYFALTFFTPEILRGDLWRGPSASSTASPRASSSAS